jgi:hypothetical protein
MFLIYISIANREYTYHVSSKYTKSGSVSQQ